MKVWARKSAVDQVDYALQQGIEILDYFETFFDEDFPLPKTGESLLNNNSEPQW